MVRFTSLAGLALFATPALAQQNGGNAVGFVTGGIIGILLLSSSARSSAGWPA